MQMMEPVSASPGASIFTLPHFSWSKSAAATLLVTMVAPILVRLPKVAWKRLNYYNIIAPGRRRAKRSSLPNPLGTNSLVTTYLDRMSHCMAQSFHSRKRRLYDVSSLRSLVTLNNPENDQTEKQVSDPSSEDPREEAAPSPTDAAFDDEPPTSSTTDRRLHFVQKEIPSLIKEMLLFHEEVENTGLRKRWERALSRQRKRTSRLSRPFPNFSDERFGRNVVSSRDKDDLLHSLDLGLSEPTTFWKNRSPNLEDMLLSPLPSVSDELDATKMDDHSDKTSRDTSDNDNINQETSFHQDLYREASELDDDDNWAILERQTATRPSSTDESTRKDTVITNEAWGQLKFSAEAVQTSNLLTNDDNVSGLGHLDSEDDSERSDSHTDDAHKHNSYSIDAEDFTPSGIVTHNGLEDTLGTIQASEQETPSESSGARETSFLQPSVSDSAFVDQDIMAKSHQFKENSFRVEAITAALAFLQTISEEEWNALDNICESDEEPVDDTLDDGEAKSPDSSSNFILEDENASALSEIAKKPEVADEETAFGASNIDELLELLEDAKLGNSALTTMDYNLILSRLAISSELLSDEVLDTMMETYRQMSELAAAGLEDRRPDATTYEILLLTLSRRLSAFKTAFGLIQEMIKSPDTCSAQTLTIAFRICESRRELGIARALLDQLRDDESGSIKIPNQIYLSLLNMMKAEDAKDQATSTLQVCLEKNTRRIDKNVDAVIINAIHWPTRNRLGKLIDNTSVLKDVLEIIENSPSYSPGFRVWRELVVAFSRGAPQSTSNWGFVRRSFEGLSSSHPEFWPDHSLLRIGLEAGEAIPDPRLAADLICRHILHENRRYALTEHNPWRANEIHSQFGSSDPSFATAFATETRTSLHEPSSNSTRVASQNMTKAMEICVRSNDMASSRRILDAVKTSSELVPHTCLKMLYTLALKGYANAGDSQSTEHILSEMRGSGIQPSEECYGTVIHAYAVAKLPEKARDFLESMKSDSFGDGITPSQTCYEALILADVRARAWEEALNTFETMKDSGLKPSPPTYYGLLLASFEQGGQSQTRNFVEELVASNAKVNQKGCTLVIKILLAQLEKCQTTADMRKTLRELGELDPSISEAALDLSRSLRKAELEEAREPTKAVSHEDITVRRIEAWQRVLESLLHFVKRQERGT